MHPKTMQLNTVAVNKPSRIVLVGGGSGGHITPLLAVAQELRKQAPNAQLVYIGERGGRLGDIISKHKDLDNAHQIFAGKLRRYHTEGLKQLLDVPTMLKNIRDLFFVFIGFWQSLFQLWRIKPAIVFLKGGFVSVPVGLAAAILRIPFITHDSDTLPGLANRLVARWAVCHAVAMPKEFYPYPTNKTVVTGVPLASEFKQVTAEMMRQYRMELGLGESEQVIFVTGGGLGAVRLNNAVIAVAEQLLIQFPGLYILHAAGRGQDRLVQSAYSELPEKLQNRIVVKDFVVDLYRYSGAADVVIARGGASALAEFAVQGKSCVLVPNPLLTGGHQLKNAEHLKSMDAVAVVTEEEIKDNPESLLLVVSRLLLNGADREAMGGRLRELAHENSASELSTLLLQYARVK